VRLRDVIAVVLGLAVLAGVGYGGWWWLTDTLDPEEEVAAEPGQDPTATAAAYLEAWSAGDVVRLARLVRGDPPEDFDARHRQLMAGLGASAIRFEPGELVSDVDGRAVVPVAVTATFEDLDVEATWDTELRLLRDRGEWMIDWSLATLHPEMGPSSTFGRFVEQVEREPILAADGTPLASNGTRVTFGFAPGGVSDPDAVIRAFAAAIPGSETVAERELERDDLVDDWFYPVVEVSEARAELAWDRIRRAAGTIQRASPPGTRAPYDDGFARHVVGVISEATAEQLDADPDLEQGDAIPQFGLEAVFDDRMEGSDRILVGLRDSGEDTPLDVVLGEAQDDPSTPIETTLDVAVQRAIEDALAEVEQSAAIVVVDGADGAIRGSASRPLSGFNRAFAGRYPPGSTLKLVTAEALIGAGASADTPVDCPAETSVGGLRVPNAGGRSLGATTLAAAFAASCNTTFATLGAELETQQLLDSAERFGFGVEPISPLDAFGGSYPRPQDTAEQGAASFGQGRVETSPLHLAAVAAATTQGVWHQPYLLVDDGPGEARPLATGSADILRALLLEAVVDGTGAPAAVDGEEVRGKTGSAQSVEGITHAWFIGTWEGLGFAVLVEGGGAGGEVAGPIAGRLVERLAALVRDGADPALPADAVPPEGADDLESEEPGPIDEDDETGDT
jgi:hypothetical protein